MNQPAFARALLNPDAPVPEGVIDPQGRPAPKRFAVYRNNVTSGLAKVLEAAFPAIRKLVGVEFFAAMAVVFVRQNPPKSRQLMLYGDEFPGFLAKFPPVAHLGYLADVARLEQAIRESYHAADAPALPPATLASLPETRLLQARLRFAPSLRLVRSHWPIHAIWRANCEDGPTPIPRSDEVVILRPDFDPHPHLLPAGGGAFLGGLLAGDTLAKALGDAGDSFDLTAMLGLLIRGQAITGVEE